MGNLCKLTSLQNPRYKKELRPLKSVNNVVIVDSYLVYVFAITC